MRDISLHILDIAMNSIKAQATMIEITVIDKAETIAVLISDNGKGMSEETVINATNPFFTSRTTRKVGLGIPMLYQNVRKTGGAFNILSKENSGTKIEAIFNKNHIDCLPLGDMAETITQLIMLEPDINFVYTYNEFILDTREIKDILGDVPINDVSVINLLKEDLGNLSKSF